VIHLFVMTVAFGGPMRLTGDPWFGADKLKHFFTAAAVQSVSYAGLRALGASHAPAATGAWAATAALSVGKEVRDLRSYGLFSLKDLTWDAGGAVAASLVVGHTER
jgi:putative lipoprotein